MYVYEPHTSDYYLAMKKKKPCHLGQHGWALSENIMLNEICKEKKNTIYLTSLICEI